MTRYRKNNTEIIIQRRNSSIEGESWCFVDKL
nr:MAG TPA: hypothetical protein [Caudoviricetes sp.]